MSRLAPRTLLARIFLLVAGLVLLTTAAWLVLFRFAEAEPRAREAAQLSASAVNVVRAALLASAPERRVDLLGELTNREGIRLLPAEGEDILENLPDNRFSRLLIEQIQARLGPHTRLVMSINGVQGFGISFRLIENDEDEFWLLLPRERAFREAAWSWATWGLLALGLALCVAWLIASRIGRPLKRLAAATRRLGSGQMPDPLPEEGTDELRELASAFNRMASDLARHERDRSEVLAGISHDLRTPLTRLRLEAELSINDEQSRNGIVADISQMEGVISQFMDYARADSGEEIQSVQMEEFVERIVSHQTAIGHPLLSFDCTDCARKLMIRPRALNRAINNLIDNAHKYGGGEVSLNVAWENNRLLIEIGDRGTGIPATETERLKRPFTRLDSARSNVTGTGLGLAIVERAAQLHGGTLCLMPREGGGLLARMCLSGIQPEEA